MVDRATKDGGGFGGDLLANLRRRKQLLFRSATVHMSREGLHGTHEAAPSSTRFAMVDGARDDRRGGVLHRLFDVRSQRTSSLPKASEVEEGRQAVRDGVWCQKRQTVETKTAGEEEKKLENRRA